jgi:murein DD-endopeptidase MepM/ murein hydrolase activator NlpD
VRGAGGRSSVGLVVGIVVAAFLLSGLPAAAETVRSAAAHLSSSGSAASKAAAKATQDTHDAAALIVATQALEKAQTQLTAATVALATAKDELAAARAADVKARSDLNTAVLAEQRATRELAAVRSRIVSNRTDLGRLARSTYQAGGSFGEWSLALTSQSPSELAGRLATMLSVANAGNAMIAQLQQDRADLLNSQARLTASREGQESARERTRIVLADKTAKQTTTTEAKRRVGVVVKARKAALAAAAGAIVEDRARYQTMLVQSGTLAQRIRALASSLASDNRPPKGSGVFDRPGRGVVTSPYGPRMHPVLHYVKVHTGIDFGAADGIAYAADNGVVLMTEFNVAYGNMTVIDHGTLGGQHVTTLYAHQAAFGVRPGDRVTKGQPIGVIGSTGFATGPHLHFEVRIDGNPLDPATFITNAELPPTPTGAVRR